MIKADYNLLPRKTLDVSDFFKATRDKVHFVSPNWMDEPIGRLIREPIIQALSLPLAGFVEGIEGGSLQVVRPLELAYFSQVGEKTRHERLKKIADSEVPAIMFTECSEIPAIFMEELAYHGIPLLATPLNWLALLNQLSPLLDRRLAAEAQMHGTLLDVDGVGVLLYGESGIGKSETALSLLVRGHRLVADDMVILYQRHDGALIGRAARSLEHHMEIRGIGIINIEHLYGIAAIRSKKRVQMFVELVEWNSKAKIERLGLDEKFIDILDIPVNYTQIQAAPGRNIGVIVEVAARNFLLKMEGVHSSQIFQRRIEESRRISGID